MTENRQLNTAERTELKLVNKRTRKRTRKTGKDSENINVWTDG